MTSRSPGSQLAGVAAAGVLVAVLGTSTGRALTVRVRSEHGIPRIVVDGQPVRARMFWGRPGQSPLPVGPEGSKTVFAFTAVESEPEHATMHIRFGREAGTIDLDRIQVTDLDTARDVIPLCDFEAGGTDFSRDWTFWPTGEANTVAEMDVREGIGADGSRGLRVVLRSPPAGKWPDFHIYHLPNLSLSGGHRYRVSFWARASEKRNVTIAFYRPGSPFVHLGGPPGPFGSQIRLAADSGIDFVSMPLPLPWPEPGSEVDWTGVDARCRAVLAANPGALLIPRIGMEPPRWWKRRYPEAVMVWEDGARSRGVAVASARYVEDACERLGALVKHVEASFGDRIAGYHPCGQNTGEWFYQDTWKPAVAGYSEGTTAAWREWLRQRYGTDAALARAWGIADASLSAALPPPPAIRHGAMSGVLREPVSERPLVDFAAFQQDAMAECVCALAHAVRIATEGRKLVVFFFGYVYEFAAVHKGPAESGHYGLRQVLSSPDIDILCSPISYWDRGLGGTAHAMTAAESVALADKMWLYEDDTATHLSSGVFPGWKQKVATLQETNALLTRNVFQESTRHIGTWWMDLGGSGWFNDARMWHVLEQLAPIDRGFLDSGPAFRPGVAAVVHPESMLLVNEGGNRVTRPLVYESRSAFGRMGTPYGQYLLDDVVSGRVAARLKVFLNAWCLGKTERDALRRATANDLCVWCYAPGYVDDDRFSLAGMRDVTGFTFEELSGTDARAVPTDSGRAFGLVESFGISAPVKPLFAVTDAEPGEVLARYPDGRAAVVFRAGGSGGALFVGVPGLTAELLRAAARHAGVHVYSESDCNVFANGDFVGIHACREGMVSLDFGRGDSILDALTGRRVGSGPVIRMDLRMGETRIFRIR